MGTIYARAGVTAHINAFLARRSYWAVKVGDEWLSDLDEVYDIITGTRRRVSWYEDIVLTHKNQHVSELRLYTPRHRLSSTGNIARLLVTRPASCFILNGRTQHLFGDDAYPTFQLIGRLIDSAGTCECFIWDYLRQAMSTPYVTNVKNFQPWREGATPIGALSLDVLGLEL